MKEAYYFSHDSNAKTDEKVLDLRDTFGWEGYGIYWALVETLRDTTDYRFPLKSLGGLSKNLGVKQEKISKIIHGFNLFSFDENFFWSDSLIKRMDAKDKKSKKLAESARKRWANKDANAMQMHQVVTTNAEQMQCTPLAGKERKVKEKKGKESKDIVDRIRDPSESDFIDEEKKEEPKNLLYQNVLQEYNDFIKLKTSCPAKIDGQQGNAAKAIISYLKTASNDKTDDGILGAWKYILINWTRLDAFHQGKLKLSEINSNMVNIIGQIKNGTKQTGSSETVKKWSNHFAQRTGTGA